MQEMDPKLNHLWSNVHDISVKGQVYKGAFWAGQMLWSRILVTVTQLQKFSYKSPNGVEGDATAHKMFAM